MTRKPTTKSPEERRLRKHIRELLRFQADTAGTKTDFVVREFLNLIDDEVRRTRMSIAPVVQDFSGIGFGKPHKDVTKPFFWVPGEDITCGGK